MSRSTETEVGPTGPVILRRATGPDAGPLRREGERLIAAAHPGVVEVLGSSGSDEEWELRLAHGGRPLDAVGSLAPEQVAGLAVAVATTLGDLHAAGIVHGAVEASHVLVGAHGRPVLCGFASEVGDLQPTDDVAALGALVISLLGTEEDPMLVPQRRWGRTRSSADSARRSLLLLSDHACAEPASRRPSARRLAAEIADAVPGAALDLPLANEQETLLNGADGAQEHPFDPMDALRAGIEPPPRRRPRLPALACAVVGAIVLGAGGVQLARPRIAATGLPSSPPMAAPPRPSQPTSSTTTTSEALAGPPSTCVPLSGLAGGGSGCAAPVVVDGSTVLVGTVRYQVGEPGDVVTLGDWDCDGDASPAVLRPSTGEVFVFSRWASEGDVAVRAIERVDGADHLVAEAGVDGCAHLVAVRADGSRHPIPEAASA